MEIPFYSNTKDNKHCFQATLKMILKQFFPKENYPFSKLDKITGFQKGKWTWAIRGIVFCAKKGLIVKVIEIFDYNEFAESGKNYLKKNYGKEVADIQDKNSNIRQAQKDIKKNIHLIKIEKRIPKIKDIKDLLDNNYILIININSKILSRKNGYEGHFVVVYSYSKNKLIIHDPGLPPKPAREICFKLFNQAWAYPNRDAKGIMAFKPQ